jgi:MATE family multidrug resistance protein
VGQFLGDDKPQFAERVSKRGIQLAYFYIFPFLLVFIFFPDLLIKFFNIDKDSTEFGEIYKMLVIILRFTAVYSLFDVINLVLAGTLKGAGDTAYTMKVIAITSLLIMILPTIICLNIFKMHLFYGWSFVTAYIMVLGISFYLRFISGKWKDKRVIYRENKFLPEFPEIPTPEI